LFPGWQKAGRQQEKDRIMNSKRVITGMTAVLMMLGLSSTAFADGYRGDRNDRYGAQYAYAQVISARPIIRYVDVRTPVRECWEDVQRYSTYHRPRGTGGSTLLGAVIGGVIGHQFGSGRGNDAATVAGSMIGAAIGHESGRKRYGPGYTTEHSTPVRRCETQYRSQREERIDGYDVLYRYKGQKYRTRMPYDPERKLKVRVDIRPAQ